jgi:hypothetical protein
MCARFMPSYRKAYNYLRPGIVHQDWGEYCLNLTDPFGNRLSFFERMP